MLPVPAVKAIVVAMIRVRSLQYEAAERQRYLDEAQVLYENAIERLKAAKQRLAELGGGVAWDDAPNIQQTLAAQSRPIGHGRDDQ